MTSTGSVGRDATLRLFCALDLPDEASRSLSDWARSEAVGGRPLPADHLHVTLVFLGRRPAGDVPTVVSALGTAARGAVIGPLTVARWRTTASVGMLVLEDPTGAATALQARLACAVEDAGIFRPEARAWLPHVTVVRHRGRPAGSPRALPVTRTFVPSGATAYLSRLHPSGARYEALARVPLDPLTQEAVS